MCSSDLRMSDGVVGRWRLNQTGEERTVLERELFLEEGHVAPGEVRLERVTELVLEATSHPASAASPAPEEVHPALAAPALATALAGATLALTPRILPRSLLPTVAAALAAAVACLLAGVLRGRLLQIGRAHV